MIIEQMEMIMPWNEESVMSQRLRLVEQLLLPNSNVTEICRKFNVSRKTAYKWVERYKNGGFMALENLSRAPCAQPGRVSDDIEQRIVNLHREYPYWGPRKLHDYLHHVEKLSNVPSHTTCSRVLKRNNCTVISNNKSKPATTRFERSIPNDLWQIDFKGSFMTGQFRCYPLTILDDYSRYSIGLKACRDEKRKTVQQHLITIFTEFGLPEQINFDNGNPWGSTDLDSYSSLQVWLMRLGIRVTHSAPYHPQTNGKDERFHRTLKLEVLHQKSYTQNTIQRAFDEWRHIYNNKRPHEALKGKPPCERYHVSTRPYPTTLPEPEYEEGIIKKVHKTTGTFYFEGKKFHAGKGFAEQNIVIKETDDPYTFGVFFMNYFLKTINLKECSNKLIAV